MNLRASSILCATILVAAACTEKSPPPPVEEPKAEAPAAVQKHEAAVPSVTGKSDPDCVGPIDLAVPETIEVAGRTLELNGYRLSVKSEKDEDDRAVIGVLANINEASPENLFNLERYLGFFREQGAELILVAGDSGQDRAGIETVLRKVAEAELPTVVIAGNREAKADFVDAVVAVRKDAPWLINGNRVRHVNWDDADVFTLPGYHDPRYIHAGGAGCQYFKQDVAALQMLIGDAEDAKVLLAHGQPLGEAPTALDVIAPDGRHVGDANLNGLLGSEKIPFGIFPNIKEAGVKAVADVAGAQVIAEGTKSKTLFLHPGSADSIEWTMNDGTALAGTVAVLEITGGEATHRFFRAERLTEAERAKAAEMGRPSTAQND